MAYLNIKDKLVSGESRKKAKEEATATDMPDSMLWEYLETKSCETEFEDGVLNHSFELMQNGEVVAYLSMDIPLDLDLAAEVVGYYIKKLNRLKTVMEATKE